MAWRGSAACSAPRLDSRREPGGGASSHGRAADGTLGDVLASWESQEAAALLVGLPLVDASSEDMARRDNAAARRRDATLDAMVQL